MTKKKKNTQTFKLGAASLVWEKPCNSDLETRLQGFVLPISNKSISEVKAMMVGDKA